MIVVVFGLPGSGKSYFAKRLAEHLKATYISSDEVRKALFPRPEYTSEEKMLVYQEMLRLTREASGDRVLDGTFYKTGIRDLFTGVANKIGEDLRFIEIKADQETIRQRTEKKRTTSDADFGVYLEVLKQFEPMREKHLIMDSTNEKIGEMIHRALIYLKH